MYKLLIVEDEDIIRRGLVHTINWLDLGFTVIGEAENGKRGLEIIKSCKPDLVITDIKMPEMDGLEMILKAKEEFKFESIILTSYSEFNYAKKAIEIGVSNYLLKPIDEDLLFEVVNKTKLKIDENKTLERLKALTKEKDKIEIFNIKIFIESSDSNPHILYALNKIKKHYSEKISIESIAEELFISPSYLSRKFKKETGHTFLDMLNQHRIQKSIDIMIKEKGRYRTYEIANLVGFCDYKHFCVVFKKYTNMSPKDFMKAKSVVIR